MSRLPFQKKTVLATSRPIIPLHTLANTPNHPFCILFLPQSTLSTSKSPSHTPFFGHQIAPPAHLPIPLLQLLFDLTGKVAQCSAPRRKERPCGATEKLGGVWGGAPPRKLSLQASKLPNFRRRSRCARRSRRYRSARKRATDGPPSNQLISRALRWSGRVFVKIRPTARRRCR